MLDWNQTNTKIMEQDYVEIVTIKIKYNLSYN